jgi:hypothetical protein
MIYTASFDAKEHHHGTLKSLCWRIPCIEKGKRLLIYPQNRLDFLIPARALVPLYKQAVSQHGQEEAIQVFKSAYIEQLRENLPLIRAYLKELDPEQDETWLSKAKAGEFSHRNLAFKLVQTYRPDCAGGMDVPVSVEQLSLPVPA